MDLILFGCPTSFYNRRIYILPKLIAFGLGCIPLIALTVLSGLSYWIIIVLAVVLYLGVYFLYNFKLKQPSLFADWLMYPFLGSLGCYLIVNSYSEYIFPSEIIDSLCDILTPIQVLFEPSYKICFAFAEAISDLFYGIMELLFKILHITARCNNVLGECHIFKNLQEMRL